MNGSNKRSVTSEPSSPVLNIWVWSLYITGNQTIEVMTIYQYKKLRNFFLTNTPFVMAMGIIKPKDERKYLEINKLDAKQMEAFERYLLEPKTKLEPNIR